MGFAALRFRSSRREATHRATQQHHGKRRDPDIASEGTGGENQYRSSNAYPGRAGEPKQEARGKPEVSRRNEWQRISEDESLAL